MLSIEELNLIINRTRKLSYQVYFLTTYSLGLSLSETLNLQVGDVGGRRMRIHFRRSKGDIYRFVPLPHLTLKTLRQY